MLHPLDTRFDNTCLPGMELDTPMVGLNPGGDIQFQPGPCTVTEIKQYHSGQRSECTTKVLPPQDIESWLSDTDGPATSRYPYAQVKWIFACTAPTALDAEGNYVSASETLELSIPQDIFARLSKRYQFCEALDMWRYRATSGAAVRTMDYDDTSQIRSIVFTISIRLSGSFASIIAINHNLLTNCTIVLGLRVSPYDQTLIQQALNQHQAMIGHPLLVPTILIEISLGTNMLFMQRIRHELSVVEKATGQHGWLQIPAADAPAHDSELSRLGHAAKIHVSLSYRRIEAIKCYLDLIQDSYTHIEHLISRSLVIPASAKIQYKQWMGNLVLALSFRQVDLKYNERRVDNQLTAIYGLLSQRDNMVGVSVAVESKKISEAAKRDGSALKSLTVLTAVFFPATYIATLFTLPTFSGTPIWVYWVVVVPLTLVIFGSWSCWTVYRQHRFAQETNRRDIEMDPELASPAWQVNSSQGGASVLASTLRQIRMSMKDIQTS
ncbi:hypothetical protein BJX61DRAFT_541760 [Aspergillus egyptiacus]|nr:hypothetical protein BJX61DRAFT_541760 [Aspergillus egyptiacus]